MKTTIEYAEKMEALKGYLIEQECFTSDEVEDLTETFWESFEVCGREYAVFTDEEADFAARSNILDSLWAFNPHFILRHTNFYSTSSVEEDEAFEDALKELQGRICEGANPIIRALIVNLDEFVNDAIQADGRGHFIAQYDGEEIEINGGKYYAYRMN
jgi:hypothetical protein